AGSFCHPPYANRGLQGLDRRTHRRGRRHMFHGNAQNRPSCVHALSRSVGYAVGLVLCLVLAWATSEHGARYLPDGSRVELLAVTYGAEHHLPRGSALQRSVYSVLPAWFRSHLRWPEDVYRSASGRSLVVWTS